MFSPSLSVVLECVGTTMYIYLLASESSETQSGVYQFKICITYIVYRHNSSAGMYCNLELLTTL